MRSILPVLLVAATLALSTGAEAKKARRAKRGSDDLPFRFRFGLTLDGARNIELGDRTTVADEAVLGGNIGASYVGIERLSLDVDLELAMNLVRKEKDPLFDRLQLTPGARFDIIENLYLRAGAPFLIYPAPFNVGVLAGVGYRPSLGSAVGGYVELAYERYFLKDGRGESRIVLRGGVEAGN
ncbi:MAG: hypothetical protein ACOX6T_23190 [Myxococcales bacterium]|jgi:hypothetical protein